MNKQQEQQQKINDYWDLLVEATLEDEKDEGKRCYCGSIEVTKCNCGIGVCKSYYCQQTHICRKD